MLIRGVSQACLINLLHAQPNRGEVDDMIWEVDEDCDGMVSWLEFQTMYTRCVYGYMYPCACHTHVHMPLHPCDNPRW